MRNFSIRPRDDGRKAKRVLASPLTHRRGCFDDEIAIDFPALPSVVEKMREAFVDAGWAGDGSSSLLAELRLSVREAYDGVTVPLDLPVRKWCVPCGGRGEIWCEPCESCGGSGESLSRHAVRLVVPPRVRNGDRFSLCVSTSSAPPTRVEVRVVLS